VIGGKEERNQRLSVGHGTPCPNAMLGTVLPYIFVAINIRFFFA
jgi:hypothetical protein